MTESPEKPRQSSPSFDFGPLLDWSRAQNLDVAPELELPKPGRVWPLTRMEGFYALAPPRPVEGPDW